MKPVDDTAKPPRCPHHTVKHCPACGSERVAVRDDTSVSCAVCGYVVFFNVASAVAAVIEDDIGRVLLVERAKEPAKGTLDLPGGFVEPGETAEDALVREVKEELNLRVQRCSLKYLGSFPNQYLYAGIVYWTLDIAFMCTVDAFTEQSLSEEVSAVRFYRASEIPVARIGFASIRNIMEAYRKMAAKK